MDRSCSAEAERWCSPAADSGSASGSWIWDKARCVLHVSSSPPFRTGLAALIVPGSAPVILLHGVPMKRRCPFRQFHRSPPAYSLRVHWVPVFPSAHQLGAFAVSPQPGVHGFPIARLLWPIRLSSLASSFREAFPLTTSHCFRSTEEFHWVGRMGGALPEEDVSPIPPVRTVACGFRRIRLTTEGYYGSCPFRQLHGAFSMDSFTRSLGTFVLFPDPLPQGLRHVRGFPRIQTTMPYLTAWRASEFRWALPCLLSTLLHIPSRLSRVHRIGLKQNAVGGVFLLAPSTLCGFPDTPWGRSGLPMSSPAVL